MRSAILVANASPCDTNFSDSGLQTVRDFHLRNRQYCANLDQCLKIRNINEKAHCYQALAVQIARIAMNSRKPIEVALEEAKKKFLAENINGEFWVCRNNKWELVSGLESVMAEIMLFARTVIDSYPGDRRIFNA